jgi:hypothetical protein
VSAAHQPVPDWVSDLDKPFVAPREPDAEAAQEKAHATGQGRNRAAGTYRNRAMTTNPGKEG